MNLKLDLIFMFISEDEVSTLTLWKHRLNVNIYQEEPRFGLLFLSKEDFSMAFNRNLCEHITFIQWILFFLQKSYAVFLFLKSNLPGYTPLKAHPEAQF